MYDEEYKNLKTGMEIRYGSAYMGAMRKLSEENPYDDKGMLKPEFALSLKEKDALLFYVNQNQQEVPPMPEVSKELPDGVRLNAFGEIERDSNLGR